MTVQESQGPHPHEDTVTATINPRSYQEERRYVGVGLDQLIALRRRLITEAGASDQIAAGLIGWIVAKSAGDPDHTSAPTRSTYRKLLRRLDGPLTEEERQAPIILALTFCQPRRRWGRRRPVMDLAGAA